MNIIERDKRIKLDINRHIYIIDETEEYISTTTFIKLFFPKFDSEKIIDNWMKNEQKWLSNKYYGKTKEMILELWDNNCKISCSLGSLLHNSIELYYKNELDNIPKEIEKEFNYFLNFNENEIKLNNKILFKTEWSIFDEEYKIAGSIDVIYTDNNQKYYIYDWKRTNKIKYNNFYQQGLYPCHLLDNCNYNHYSLQLNIYKYILEKNYNIIIESMNLVYLHPDESNYKIETIPNLQSCIDKMFYHYKNK